MITDMKYHIIVFGCQMNISDAERVASVLENSGYQKLTNITGADLSAEALAKADLIVVVMCSVRQSAVDRVHGLKTQISKLKSQNHSLKPKTILTGCVLKKDRKIFAEVFDYVMDIKEIGKIPDLLASASEELLPSDYFKIVPKYENQFSANVPIITGCNNFCAYCVVPYTREREISRPAKDILREIRNFTNPTSPPPSRKASEGQGRLRGAKEIWLLGQNVNSYHGLIRTNGTMVNFAKLLKMINKIPGSFWIRFTSSHPKDFNDSVIDAMVACEKVAPYLNLPVQSGDDKILKAMNRHYTIKEYKNKIKKLREKIPDIAISTDIIVGFPGETKKQFENTAKLFRDVKYDMAYINKYSSRAGTAASKLKDNVSREEKKRREKILTDILKQTALAHNKKLVGKKMEVLIDSERNGAFFGKTATYKTIKIRPKHTPYSSELEMVKIGDLIKVKITKADPFTLEGKIV